MHKPARIRLVWRLYAIGVAQLLLTALVTIAIASLLQRAPGHWDTRDLTKDIRTSVDQPEEARRLLEREGKARELGLSLYEETNGETRLIATNVTPAVRPPPWNRERHGDHGEPGPPFGAPPGPPPSGANRSGPEPPPEEYLPFNQAGRAFVLVAEFEPGPWRNWPFLSIAFGFLIVAAGSFVTTRFLARPLDRLTRAARALGAGDLRARAELHRGDELGELSEAFDEMAERIAHLLGAERELLANVSHELRTPLARIHVALDLATEGDGKAARSAISDIAIDLAELERLVDDILQATRFAMVEGGPHPAGFALRREPSVPRDIATSALARLRAHHPERPVNLSIEGDPPALDLDPQLVRRALVNLLENAHKYTPDTALPIEVDLRREGDLVRFTVSDHGIGIPAADRPRVFDAFYRSERSRSRGTGGVGLGLTLTKRIVEAHGGSVALEENAEPGAGTRISITFTIGNASERAETQAGATL